MPLPHAIEDLYGVAPAEYWPAEYFQAAPGYLDGQCTIALELLGGREGLTALDVGAGIGKGVLAMERHGFRAVGLEPSPEFCRWALERMGLRADQMLQGTVEAADFAAGSFDYVNFSAVLEHVRDPRRALGRALEWTRPGGIVHAEVPSARWLLGRSLNTWYRMTGQDFVTNTSPMHPPYHLYEFTLRSFEAAASSLSCRLDRHEVWRGDVVGPRPLRSILGRLMDATGTGMQLAVWLRRS
jgi:SAM-dependent methyltransferase